MKRSARLVVPEGLAVGAMIIDFEHHYFPEVLVRRYGCPPGQAVPWLVDGFIKVHLHDRLFDLEAHLRHMDEAGIDVAVLSSWDPPLEECRLINDSLVDVMRRYPGRFVGMAHVPPLGGESARDELRRAVHELGLRGISMTAQVEGHPLDAPQLWPFYEEVQRLGQPLFIHPSSVVRGFEVLRAPYELHTRIGREFDLLLATTRLILGGVLEDFPDLKIVIAHLGGGIAAIKERIDVRYGEGILKRRPEGVRATRPFGDYLGRLYFDLAGFQGGMNAVHCALTTLRPQQLVFATDYPQNFADGGGGMARYIERIGQLGLDPETTAAILGETAAGLLGLPLSPGGGGVRGGG